MSEDNFDTLDELPTIKGDDGRESKILADRYKIIGKLGEGGMGLVYLAEDTEINNEKVAIKFVPPMLASNVRVLKSLSKEAGMARKLSHPNIVRLHDLHTDGHQKFLVMEYIEGKTLEEILAEKEEDKFTLEELLPIAEQVAAGLDYAHNRKVLHRDLKPSNIMIATDGTVKLLDFGIAREMKDSYTRVTGKETSGTLPYMSPQQLMGEPPTPAMDVYSFAAVLYECLSGRPPFYMGDIREQIKSKIPADLSGVSFDTNNAILSALAKNPALRPKKPSELVAILMGQKKAPVYEDTLDLQKTRDIKAEKAARRSKTAKIVAALIIVAMIALGVVLGIRAYRQGKTTSNLAVSLWSQAQAAAQISDYEKAIELVDKLVTEYPGAPQAEQALAQKYLWSKALTEQKQRQSQITTLLSQAQTLKNEGLLDKSLEAVVEVLKLDAENATAKSLRVELSSLIDKQKTESEKEQSFRNFSEAGFIYEAKSDWQKAIDSYTKALTFKPEDAEVKEKLATCQHNLYLSQAQEAESKGELDTAISLYTKALSYKQVASTQMKLDSSKEALRSKIEAERRQREYEKWFKLASEAEANGDLPAAVKFYEKVQIYSDEKLQSKIDSLNQKIADKQKQGKFNQLLTDAKSKDSKTTGKEALKILEEALALYPDNAEALSLKKKIQGYFGPNPGDVVTNTIGMKLVYIPAGSFMMGSPSEEKDRYNDEGPQHKVKLSKGFYMGVYEVTQFQFQAVMGTNPSNFKGSSLPVEQVSWNDAVEFCRKLSQKEGRSYRLPTEAEWEYACRAGTTTPFYFGYSDSDLDDYAWCGYEKSGKQTHPVGQKKPNSFGLYDMHGNVWEWCQDWYGENYYSQSPEVDPQGPSSGEYRVLRGGSWNSLPWVCREV